ncbi:hypothetical protein ON010_g2069 [Phytophthora cinnamomi]|nr:hypothetical protein ON010_g2069 [Phytophthora cinnamomi]
MGIATHFRESNGQYSGELQYPNAILQVPVRRSRPVGLAAAPDDNALRQADAPRAEHDELTDKLTGYSDDAARRASPRPAESPTRRRSRRARFRSTSWPPPVLTPDFVAQPAFRIVYRATLAEERRGEGLLLMVGAQQSAHLARALAALLDSADSHPVLRLLQCVGETNSRAPSILTGGRGGRNDTGKVFGLHL